MLTFYLTIADLLPNSKYYICISNFQASVWTDRILQESNLCILLHGAIQPAQSILLDPEFYPKHPALKAKGQRYYYSSITKTLCKCHGKAASYEYDIFLRHSNPVFALVIRLRALIITTDP